MLAPLFQRDEWPLARPHIESALATSVGLETITDVTRMLTSGQYKLWSSERSAAITEVSNYAQKKALTVIHGGGDLAELVGLEPAMCEYARAIGCNMIMGTGRIGWKRVCERLGYRFGFITMCKDLT